MKSGRDAGLQHGLHQRQDFPGVSHAQFEAGRLAAGKVPHLGNEVHKVRWAS
jgi:hypothetical protein